MTEYSKDLFKAKFGPVMDSVVISSHFGYQVQSCGFGFVTFQYKESFQSFCHSHLHFYLLVIM